MTDSVTSGGGPGSQQGPPPRTLSRRIAFGFGAVAVVVFVMCGALLQSIAAIASSVRAMQEDELAVRESLALAMAVREQYIHYAHVLIEDESHLDHYQEWVERVRAGAAALKPRLEPSEQWRVERVVAQSDELDRLFRSEMVPALGRADRARLVDLHRKAEKLSAHAVAGADTIAGMTEQRMNRRHEHAVSAARRGFGIAAGGLLLVVFLSVAYTAKIRRSVLVPLGALSESAQRIGHGDFDVRLGSIGEGELASVARAVDRMAEELRARERRLIETERMAIVGQLAAGVAHEINNPIGVIRGYLRTIDTSELPASVAEELRVIDEEAAACQRIAEDLLAFSRAGELSLAPVEMDELLERTARRFQDSGEVAGHGIDLDLHPGSIEADAGRLRQVVLNLLRNAVRASPADEPIEIAGHPTQGGGYVFSVSDRGPGVPAAERARIFEPFYSTHGSSGLGLAVCHGIVAAHGGTIAAEPRLGGGSVFSVELRARGGR